MFCRPNMFVKTVLLKLFRRPKLANNFVRGCMRPADRILVSPDLNITSSRSTDSKLVHRMLENATVVISHNSIAPFIIIIIIMFVKG